MDCTFVYWSPIVEHLETQSPYVHHNTHTMRTKHPISLNEITESPAMPNRAAEQLLQKHFLKKRRRKKQKKTRRAKTNVRAENYRQT